jgi:hypothetical protein
MHDEDMGGGLNAEADLATIMAAPLEDPRYSRGGVRLIMDGTHEYEAILNTDGTSVNLGRYPTLAAAGQAFTSARDNH